MKRAAVAALLAGAALAACADAPPSAVAHGAKSAGSAEHGRMVFSAAGGCTCHTNYPGEDDAAPELAGGRAIETPFGVFYSTNITPDRATGVGSWSEADFARAMREG